MTREQRAALLRERFAAIGGESPTPMPRKAPKVNSRGWFSFGQFGDHKAPRLTDWAQTPDEKPKITPKPERRRKGETALTRIAAVLPRKLLLSDKAKELRGAKAPLSPVERTASTETPLRPAGRS